MNLVNRIVTVALAIWLCTMVGLKAWQFRQAPDKRVAEARVARHWQELTSERPPVLGTPAARLKIVEFSDYQCPFCAASDPVLTAFVARHNSDAALYRYDFPLEAIHHYSYAAAIAADCAEMQGITLPYQSLLFEHREQFATLNWTALARQAGITDPEAFGRCVRDETPHNRIRKDIARGKEQLGITATPTFIINGELVTGSISQSKLDSLYTDLDHAEHRSLLDRISSHLIALW